MSAGCGGVWVCDGSAGDAATVLVAEREFGVALVPARFFRVERGVAVLERERVVELLGEFAAGATDPAVDSDRDKHEWLRLGCDDLRNWYMEAAQGQPGRGSSSELNDWLWRDTALARLIGLAAAALLAHPDLLAKDLAGVELGQGSIRR